MSMSKSAFAFMVGSMKVGSSMLVFGQSSAVVDEVTICCHGKIFVDFEEFIEFRIGQVQFLFHDRMQPESENIVRDIFVCQVSKK